MTTPLYATLYAPPLAVDDPRPLAAVTALEAALPGVHLEHEVTAELRSARVADRAGFLQHAGHDRRWPMLWSGDDHRYAMVHGQETPAILGPGEAVLTVQLALATAEPMDLALGAVGDAVAATWGAASPAAVNAVVAAQTVHPHLPRQPPLGLPALQPPTALRGLAAVQRLGWINYWSDAVAAGLGFPDPARDGKRLARARRTARGWVVTLTAEPLDLTRADHLAILREAYARFATIGGR